MELGRIALIVAIVIGVVAMRLRGEPLRVKGLVVLPAAVTGIGLWDLYKHAHHVTAGAVAFFVLSIVTSIGFGLWRGSTIELSERRGYLYYRYRPMTLVVWVASFAARGLELLLQHAAGAASLGSQSLMVGLGATLLGEAALVYPRATRLGVPFAPDDRRGRTGLSF
ncbi:MAG TPA: hypothetical protein VHC49_06125 [Mycobacteriales bacterium]|nr:hypothetical protein [Mycobacteriales bacterium]